MPDATRRFSLNGDPLFHYMGTSTFANHTVVPGIALAKIRSDAPFDKVCYIGGGVTSGLAAVLFTARVEAGQPLTLRRHDGYDHGYYFISTFIEDPLRCHGAALPKSRTTFTSARRSSSLRRLR